MKLLFVLTLLASVTAQAHCPTEIQINQNAYCLAIKWQNAEQKVKGVLQTTPQSSPQLVAMQEIPLKWLYSSAAFVLWKKVIPVTNPSFLKIFVSSLTCIWPMDTITQQAISLSMMPFLNTMYFMGWR